MRTLEGWGDLSIRNLFRAVAARRAVPLERFLFALGIRRIGEQNAKLLARHYGTVERWRAAMLEARVIGSEAREELGGIAGIGPAIANEVVEFIAEPHNLQALDDLLGFVAPEAAQVAEGGAFAGKALVFTGTLETMSRAEAEAKAEGAGGRIAKSVSRKTDFVVVGADAGTKAAKAAALGVAVLTEAEFLQRLET